MIYEFPESNEPIRQGDIFVGIPKAEIELSQGLAIINEDQNIETVPWIEVATNEQPVTVVLGMQPVTAIVLTQDCDARRATDITLCEIRDFFDIERGVSRETTPKKLIPKIVSQSKVNLKWFYLPPDGGIGFSERMAVDLLMTLRIARDDLQSLISLRRGRLNTVAGDHFRERIAYFFRRYAYDEWYPFGKDEIEYYPNRLALDPSDLFPWQR